MKAKIVRSDIEVHPDLVPPEQQEFVCLKPTMRNGTIQQIPFFKMDSVIEDPNAHLWVRQGIAIAVDEECSVACAKSEEQLKEARNAYQRLQDRIAPEDYELYEAGYIRGYNPDGSYIPGPNWDKMPKDDDDADDGDNQ